MVPPAQPWLVPKPTMMKLLASLPMRSERRLSSKPQRPSSAQLALRLQDRRRSHA
jgi:hypothetical protein